MEAVSEVEGILASHLDSSAGNTANFRVAERRRFESGGFHRGD